MTEAICFHCSGVGSVPVGLCAQAWRTKMEDSGAFWGEGSCVSSNGSSNIRGSQSVTNWARGSVFLPHVLTQKPPFWSMQGCFRLSPLSTDPKTLPCSSWHHRGLFTFHLIAHLQIIQETLEIESSLRCIPIVIGPNVFKSSGRKHTVMILCKQKGKKLNALTNMEA